MTDEEFSLFVQALQTELYASSPIKTGAMQASIALISLDGEKAQIAIAVPYASYVDNRQLSGPHNHYHWVENVIERVAKTFCATDVTTEVIGI